MNLYLVPSLSCAFPIIVAVYVLSISFFVVVEVMGRLASQYGYYQVASLTYNVDEDFGH